MLLPQLAFILCLPFQIFCFSCAGEEELDIEVVDPSLQVEKYISGAEEPWGMAFLPNGDQYLVSTTLDFLLLYENDELIKHFSYPDSDRLISKCGDGAIKEISHFLDVILDPDFESNHQLYLSAILVARVMERDIYRHVIIKLGYDPEARSLEKLSGDSLLFEECSRDNFHHPVSSPAARFAFLADKTLLFPVGPHHHGNEGNSEEEFVRSQDKGYYAGKVLRMTREGQAVCEIAGIADNPFCGEAGAAADYIYTLGHKNSQGIAVHPDTDLIYASEHGQVRGDELNLLQAGANYGFPHVCPGDCAPYYGGFETTAEAFPLPPELSYDDFTPAWFYWETSGQAMAPSGIALYHWEGLYQDSLLVAGLGGRRVDRIRINSDGSPDYQGAIAENLRFRQVRIGEAGEAIYLLAQADAGKFPIVKLRFRDEE